MIHPQALQFQNITREHRCPVQVKSVCDYTNFLALTCRPLNTTTITKLEEKRHLIQRDLHLPTRIHVASRRIVEGNKSVIVIYLPTTATPKQPLLSQLLPSLERDGKPRFIAGTDLEDKPRVVDLTVTPSVAYIGSSRCGKTHQARAAIKAIEYSTPGAQIATIDVSIKGENAEDTVPQNNRFRAHASNLAAAEGLLEDGLYESKQRMKARVHNPPIVFVIDEMGPLFGKYGLGREGKQLVFDLVDTAAESGICTFFLAQHDRQFPDGLLPRLHCRIGYPMDKHASRRVFDTPDASEVRAEGEVLFQHLHSNPVVLQTPFLDL